MTRADRWLLLGCALLAGLGGAGAATYFHSKASLYYLDIPLAAETAIVSQVFYDRGEGFREQDSVKVAVAPASELRRIRFQLPLGPIRALRFDPTIAAGRVSIGRSAIRSRGDELSGRKWTYAEFSPDAFQAVQQIERIERSEQALQIFVPAGLSDPYLQMALAEPMQLGFNHRYFWISMTWAAAGAGAITTALFFLGRGISRAWLRRRRRVAVEAFAPGGGGGTWGRAALATIRSRHRQWLPGAGALLVLAGWGAGNLYLLWRPPAAELVLELSSTVESSVQVFFDTGAGFREQESIRRAVDGGNVAERLTFPLPTQPVRSLRLDPMTGPGTVEIRSANIAVADDPVAYSLNSAQITPLHDIEALTASNFGDKSPALRVVAGAAATDPALLVSLPQPFLARLTPAGMRERLWPWNVGLVALAVTLAAGWRGRWAQAIHRGLGHCARRLSRSHFLEWDRFALVFCVLCLALFTIMVGARLHGSSISLFGLSYDYWDNPRPPLLGTPKGVRSDEWAYHTPCVLYQVFRDERFSVESTPLGAGGTSLFSNIPVAHFSALFRPNFWPFFLLGPDFAFSAYWQSKWLLLVLGSFSLLLLLTRSSRLAAFGSLWLLWSSHTQWSYSWSSLLPELIGYICLGTVLACYLLVGRNRAALALAAAGLTVCAVSFACSLYVPHQLPLAVLGVSVAAWWVRAHWGRIVAPHGRAARVAALAFAGLTTLAVMLAYWFDVREALQALASTTYPGKRSLSGGALNLPFFASDYLDFWKREGHVPPQLANISEASGYLWLAPITLAALWPARSRASRRLPAAPADTLEAAAAARWQDLRLALAWLWVALGILAVWTLLPIPQGIAKLVLFDKVLWNRCLPAMGLANIAIVCVFLAMVRPPPKGTDAGQPARARGWLNFSHALFISWIVLLCLLETNRHFQAFFTSSAVLLATLYGSAALFFTLKRWRAALTALILLPHLYFYGLVQPVDRGLDQLTNSPLFRFMHGEGADRRLRQERWLVFSRWIEPPGFFTAVGCKVLNGLKYVPPLEDFQTFDPQGVHRSLLNRAGYFVAAPLTAEGAASTFSKDEFNVITWSVSPLDPGLRQRGVRFLAFDDLPDSTIRGKLRPLAAHAVSGFWLYELP